MNDQTRRQPRPVMKAPGTPGTGKIVCSDCHGKGTLNRVEYLNCESSSQIVKGIGGA